MTTICMPTLKILQMNNYFILWLCNKYVTTVTSRLSTSHPPLHRVISPSPKIQGNQSHLCLLCCMYTEMWTRLLYSCWKSQCTSMPTVDVNDVFILEVELLDYSGCSRYRCSVTTAVDPHPFEFRLQRVVDSELPPPLPIRSPYEHKLFHASQPRF